MSELHFPLAKTGLFLMLPSMRHLTKSPCIKSSKGHHSQASMMWICQHAKDNDIHQLQHWVSHRAMTMMEMMTMIKIKGQWQWYHPNLGHMKS